MTHETPRHLSGEKSKLTKQISNYSTSTSFVMASGKVPARHSRHSCKAFLQQGASASFMPGFQQRVPSKVQAEIPASQFQPGIVVFHCLPQFEKRKKQNKTQRKSRNCLHIGSSKFAKQFQQSSS
jgi:hypothetical protein